MKKFIALLALTVSVGAFAQEVIYATQENLDSPSPLAEIIRQEGSPEKINVEFHNIPMTVYEPRYETRPGTCYRNVTRTICRNVPRANPPRQTCSSISRTEPYACYVQTRVYPDIRRDFTRSDKVKIKFKDLPALRDGQTEVFSVMARQDGNSEDVEYMIQSKTTVTGAPYEVKKKGILGYDSYVIQAK